MDRQDELVRKLKKWTFEDAEQTAWDADDDRLDEIYEQTGWTQREILDEFIRRNQFNTGE